MARGLDHVVHVVRDLGEAALGYERMGFTLGARNSHPWGTHNRLVQFPGFFLEILAIAEREKIPPPEPGKFSFGAYNRDFLKEAGEGLSCLVLESDDPTADKGNLDRAGFGGFELLNFTRMGKRADGSDTEVGFSIAFARDPASPHTAFFTCRQTHPENFWSPELQRHPNSAMAVAAAVLVAENPSEHHIFLEAFTGVRDLRASSLGLRITTPRGAVLAFNSRGFADQFGVDAPQDKGLRLGALLFRAADLATVRRLFERNGVSYREYRGRLVVDFAQAMGAVIAFEVS